MHVDRLRQGFAAAHRVANGLKQMRDRQRRREADQYFQRAIERQAGLQQRRQLARDRQQLIAIYLPRLEPAPAALGGSGGTRGPAGKRCLDLHGHQALIAQSIDDLRLVRGFELAGRDVARGVHRAISEERHVRVAFGPSSRA